jgi:isopenicillin N synthase-like dioxygenase
MNVPTLDMEKIIARDPSEMAVLAEAVRDIGFLMVENTALTKARVEQVIEAYRGFFHLPEPRKSVVDMAQTGSNRGWGAPGSEQVDPQANPDYKEVFDCGFELPADHPLTARHLSVYAPNQWPEDLPEFRAEITAYYTDALRVSMQLLQAIAGAIGEAEDAFDAAFDAPMALLRGNYYPARPDWASDKDFGIAAHTDYGCLTLLATDGTAGLDVQMPDGSWQAVSAQPGRFVINFGEMLEMWTEGRVKATLHRVVGGPQERISVPLFFNPSYDTNVAPPGSGRVMSAGVHLTERFNETYLHLQRP